MMNTVNETANETVNEELTGTLDQVEELLTFAAGSLEASSDAEVRASEAAILAYTARIRQMLADLESQVIERRDA